MKPTKEDKLPKKEKLKISLATAKKILKSTKLPIGQSETIWVNQYVENAVRGSCLPLALLSNDFLSELPKAFGPEKASDFLEQMLKDFLVNSPKTAPTETEQSFPTRWQFRALKSLPLSHTSVENPLELYPELED